MVSEQTSLYFFSAWLQADAAMFAIVGLFAVYKLQSLEGALDEFVGGSKRFKLTARKLRMTKKILFPPMYLMGIGIILNGSLLAYHDKLHKLTASNIQWIVTTDLVFQILAIVITVFIVRFIILPYYDR